MIQERYLDYLLINKMIRVRRSDPIKQTRTSNWKIYAQHTINQNPQREDTPRSDMVTFILFLILISKGIFIYLFILPTSLAQFIGSKADRLGSSDISQADCDNAEHVFTIRCLHHFNRHSIEINDFLRRLGISELEP